LTSSTPPCWAKLIYITIMDVETIYKDKLKGKYKFTFDLKEKQSV
jgi:hypothetical protein